MPGTAHPFSQTEIAIGLAGLRFILRNARGRTSCTDALDEMDHCANALHAVERASHERRWPDALDALKNLEQPLCELSGMARTLSEKKRKSALERIALARETLDGLHRTIFWEYLRRTDS